jgi:hypothetical protein
MQRFEGGRSCRRVHEHGRQRSSLYGGLTVDGRGASVLRGLPFPSAGRRVGRRSVWWRSVPNALLHQGTTPTAPTGGEWFGRGEKTWGGGAPGSPCPRRGRWMWVCSRESGRAWRELSWHQARSGPAETEGAVGIWELVPEAFFAQGAAPCHLDDAASPALIGSHTHRARAVRSARGDTPGDAADAESGGSSSHDGHAHPTHPAHAERAHGSARVAHAAAARRAARRAGAQPSPGCARQHHEHGLPGGD